MQLEAERAAALHAAQMKMAEEAAVREAEEAQRRADRALADDARVRQRDVCASVRVWSEDHRRCRLHGRLALLCALPVV